MPSLSENPIYHILTVQQRSDVSGVFDFCALSHCAIPCFYSVQPCCSRFDKRAVYLDDRNQLAGMAWVSHMVICS